MGSIFEDYERRNKKKKDFKENTKELVSKTISNVKIVGGVAGKKFGQIAKNYYKNTNTEMPDKEHPIWDRKNRRYR